MTFVGLAVLALTLGQAAPPRGEPVRPVRPPAPAGLSWEDADWVAGTVARIEQRLTAGKPASRQTIVVTERQLNSYLGLSLASKIPPGLSGLEVAFQRDRLLARGVLDLDRLKSKMPQGAGLLAFLSGSVPVELRGRFSSADGTGRVEVEEALVAGISLPPAVLAQIVTQSTRSAKRPQGFDILAPFPLPFGARRVRLEPGRALVDFLR
ncbi:MAG TPA: hypothetical protein VLF95_12880 [Vicinamibacteria bacterium]|nr:hypothetical protein [Vicinamibacteria bacterium]